MAKLKARGRQEIFRIEKIKEVPRQGFTERYRVQKALMSDGNVLEKVDDGTWKVIGKVKPGLSAEQALQLYADHGWKLLNAHPAYLTVSGDTVTERSSEPLRTEKEAERSKKSRAAGAERRKKKAEKEEKGSGNEPGFYFYIVPHEYLDETAGPFDTFEQAKDAAWECLRSREHKRLVEECAAEGISCPPTRIIESQNYAQALQGKGYVWWIDGKQKGPPVDPRQTGFTNGF